MTSQVTIIPSEDRTAAIAGEIPLSTRTAPFMYRGKMQEMAKIRVPISLPIYRMSNGRTITSQMAFIRKTSAPEDMFTAGQENQEAQQAQHQLLLTLSQDANKNVYAELRRQAQQTEPLLISSTGVVVNGNRRLAAMRELYHSDPVKHAAFSHLDVAVLPPEATEDDMEEIETHLQMVPDTKLPYGWIDKRIKMRLAVERSAVDDPKAAIAARFNITVQELNNHIQQLEIAEEYLDTFLQDPGNYECVAKSEQNFASLQDHLRRLTAASEFYDIDKHIGFLIVSESVSLGQRSYAFITALKDYRALFISRAASLAPSTTQQHEESVDVGNQSHDADVSLFMDTVEQLDLSEDEVEPADNPAVAALRVLETPQLREQAKDILVLAHTEAQEKKSDDASRNAALTTAKKVNTYLASLEVGSADPETLESVESQLNTAAERIKTLLTELARHRRDA